MQSKFIVVRLPEGHTLALWAYSLDGRSWSTCKRSLVAFHRRQIEERQGCRAAFAKVDTGEEREWTYADASDG